MILEENKKYKIIIQIGDKETVLTGEVVWQDSEFFKIIDKYNEELTYNKKTILSLRSLYG
jgi:hypothetical protein